MSLELAHFFTIDPVDVYTAEFTILLFLCLVIGVPVKWYFLLATVLTQM
jgi:hypothetical protein